MSSPRETYCYRPVRLSSKFVHAASPLYKLEFFETLHICLLPYEHSYIITVVLLHQFLRSYFPFSLRIFHQKVISSDRKVSFCPSVCMS